MEIVKKYKVYKLNKVLSSSEHKALEEVDFKNGVCNNFDTEEEAIHYLLDDEKTYEDYIILKTVFIRN